MTIRFTRRLLLPVFASALILGCGAPATAVAASTTKTTHIAVSAGKPTEFAFKLSKQKVSLGKVIFAVTNRGAIPHTFKICSSPKGGHANTCRGKGTKVLSPGKTAKLTYVFKKKGTYEYICTIAGHAAAGMKGDLKVT
jgi:uncharacterized cupredoxin-like copper-binding protein